MTNKPSPSQAFRTATTRRNLLAIYDSKVRHNQAKGRDGTAAHTLAEDLPSTLALIQDRMRSGRYSFTPYRELLTLKGAGRPPREISIPTARDRIALNALSQTLLQSFEFPQMELAQRKIKKVIDSISANRYSEFVSVDIQNFYPTVDHVRLLQTLRTRTQKPEVLNLIRSAIRTPTLPDGPRKSSSVRTIGVPQGMQLSTLLAELAMSSVDKEFNEASDISYFRYVDDILILCHTGRAKEINSALRSSLSRSGFTPHDTGAKSSVGDISNGIFYLGYVIGKSTVSVRKSSVQRIELAIARTFTRYKYALQNPKRGHTLGPHWTNRCQRVCIWHLNLLVAGCIHNHQRQGWLNYYSWTNDLTTLKKLDLQVERHLAKNSFPQNANPKKFVRTHWSIRHPNSKRADYIPNFDTMKIQEMRRILWDIFFFSKPNVATMDDSEVARSFEAMITRATIDMEKNIGLSY